MSSGAPNWETPGDNNDDNHTVVRRQRKGKNSAPYLSGQQNGFDDEIEVLQDEQVDVYLGDTDPMTYKPHQVEGMILSLLYGVGHLSVLRKHARDFARLFVEDTYNISTIDSDSISTCRSKNSLGRGHSVISRPINDLLPILNVRRKTEDDVDFVQSLNRLMYDKSLRHNEANSAIWDAWYPYVGVEEEGEGEGRDRVDLIHKPTRQLRDMDGITVRHLSPSSVNDKLLHCSTVRFLGPVIRDYLSENQSTVHDNVYKGDEFDNVGSLLISENPYGYLRSGAPVMRFDVVDYFTQISSSFQTGSSVIVYPPGKDRASSALYSMSSTENEGATNTFGHRVLSMTRNGVTGTVVKKDSDSVRIRLHDESFREEISINVSDPYESIRQGWFVYPVSTKSPSSSSSPPVFYKGLPGHNVLLLRNNYERRNKYDGDYSLSVTPSVVDKFTVLPEKIQNSVTSLRSAEHFMRCRFARFMAQPDTLIMRQIIAHNIERILSLADDDISHATESVKTNVNTKAKATRRERGRGDEEISPTLQNRFLQFSDAEGDSAIQPPAEYFLSYVPFTYDTEIDHSVHRPLYLHNSADRGILHLLSHLDRHMQDMLRYVEAHYKRESVDTRSQTTKYDSPQPKKGQMKGGEQSQHGECKNKITELRTKCAKEALQNMALQGWTAGTLSNDNNNSSSNFTSHCTRVADLDGSDFTTFMYSKIRVGKHGKGSVADKTERSDPDCIHGIRFKTREALKMNREKTKQDMINFDFIGAQMMLRRDAERMRGILKLNRSTPIVGWPQMQLSDDIMAFHRHYHSLDDAYSSSSVHRSLLEEEGVAFQLQFEDLAHYAPIHSTRVQGPSDVTSTDDEGNSFISIMLEEGEGVTNRDTVKEDALITMAKGIGKTKAIIEGSPDNHKETENERMIRENRPTNTLRALLDLRNAPERAVQEVNVQIRMLRAKKEEIKRRVPSAAKDYGEFEAKLIDRIKRQATSEYLRREFVSAAGIVASVTRYHDMKGLAAIATDAVSRLPPFAKYEDLKLESITSDEIVEEYKAISSLMSRMSGVSIHQDRDVININETDTGIPTQVAAKETVVWSAFKPSIPSHMNAFHEVDVTTLKPHQAQIVLMHHQMNSIQKTRESVSNDKEEPMRQGGGDEIVKPMQRGKTTQMKGKRSQNPSGSTDGSTNDSIYNPFQSMIKIASACCTTRITSGSGSGINHYDVYDEQIYGRIVEFSTRSKQISDRDFASRADTPQRIQGKSTEVFLSYPDVIDVSVTLPPQEREVIPLISRTKQKKTDTIGQPPANRDHQNPGSTREGGTARFQRLNPAFAKDPLLTSLAITESENAKSKEQQEDTRRRTHRAATDILQAARDMWKNVITKKSSVDGRRIGEALAEDVWINLFDTSQADPGAQREAVIILRGFLQSGVRASVNELAHPRDASTMRAAAVSPSAEKARAPKTELRKRITKLEPESVFKGFRRALLDVVVVYTRCPSVLADSHEDWIGCAVLAYVICKTLMSVLKLSSVTNSSFPANSRQSKDDKVMVTRESYELASILVSVLCSELHMRYKLSHDDVRFDKIIGEQREAEKRKKLDIYGQMTEEELEELRMYKRVADFDERYLQDFLRDRRRGAAKFTAAAVSRDSGLHTNMSSSSSESPREEGHEQSRQSSNNFDFDKTDDIIEVHDNEREALMDEDAEYEEDDEYDAGYRSEE